jgi:hypothetical protein
VVAKFLKERIIYDAHRNMECGDVLEIDAPPGD